MLRLGVCLSKQFHQTPPRNPFSYLYYRLSRSRVSLQLLRSADDDRFERLMPHVQLANGVYRTTFRNRFHNLDPIVNRILCDHFAQTERLLVEDWAASACLTSCEWAQSLLPLFPKTLFTASDLVLFLVEVEDRESGHVFIADQEGRPLQYIRPPFVIRMTSPESWQTPVNRVLYESAQKRWADLAGKLWPLPPSWLDPHGDAVLERGSLFLRKLPLVHPQAMALARVDPRFSIRRQSIFESAPAPCHVIRSMNILNRAYFSTAQLAAAMQAILESLRPGGIWILGRTIDDKEAHHNVSILRKSSKDGVEVIKRIGAGADVESIALESAPVQAKSR